MTERGFLVFGTPIGACGIVWGDRGVVGVQLPESSEAAVRARVRREFPGASRVFDRAVALPFHTRLTESDLDRVTEALTSIVSK